MGGRHYVMGKGKFLKIYCFFLSNGDYSILGSALVDISRAKQNLINAKFHFHFKMQYSVKHVLLFFFLLFELALFSHKKKLIYCIASGKAG